MRMFAVAMVVAGALIGSVAQAQTMRGDMTKVCGDEGRRMNLAGAQLADFLTKCWSDGPGAQSRKACEADARRQGLSGEDLGAFMKKCTGG